jgi:hypothetical protein
MTASKTDPQQLRLHAQVTALELLCGQLFSLLMAQQIGKTLDPRADAQQAVETLNVILASNREHLRATTSDNEVSRAIGETMQRVLASAGRDAWRFAVLLGKVQEE